MVKHVGTVISNELAEKLDIVAKSENKTAYKLVRELIEAYISWSETKENGNGSAVTSTSETSDPAVDVYPTKSISNETGNEKKVVFNVGFQPRTGLILKASMPSMKKTDGILGKIMRKKKNDQKN